MAGFWQGSSTFLDICMHLLSLQNTTNHMLCLLWSACTRPETLQNGSHRKFELSFAYLSFLQTCKKTGDISLPYIMNNLVGILFIIMSIYFVSLSSHDYFATILSTSDSGIYTSCRVASRVSRASTRARNCSWFLRPPSTNAEPDSRKILLVRCF